MAFNRRRPAAAAAASPEALFSSLPADPSAPQELWVRQAMVLRDYHRDHRASKDVAIELPTGAGKTLVGGLIAEWRRRQHGERVAYLTPTKQLARQAADRAGSYGLPVCVLTGRHTDWDPAERARFQQGQAVAFAAYSSVFNSSPKLEAHTLILDDAHAAEGAVAGNWSVSIPRRSKAYDHVVEALEACGALAPSVLMRLRDGHHKEHRAIYLADVAKVAAAAADLEAVLEEAADAHEMPTDARFAAGQLSGSLAASLVYVSRSQIVLRPLIAPTRYHLAFEDAVQRVYLSATLGDGGELERAFGRRKIKRISAPADSASHGHGRRLFFFPHLVDDLRNDARDEEAFAQQVLTEFGKAIVLAPNDRKRQEMADHLVPEGLDVFDAEDFEYDPQEFIGAARGVLALANRYDGIDLPGESCRLVVLAGLPTGAHLQERFLHDSLGAVGALQERIRTRLTQGSGRATRAGSDYAAVMVLSPELVSFCLQREVQEAMPPELRAELRFGLDNSTGITAADVQENLEHFRHQDATWREAEEDIRQERDERERTPLPGTGKLAASAPAEVAAVEAAWQGDWEHAIEQARAALDALSGGAEIRRYQALWHYLTASWAVIAARQHPTRRQSWLQVATRHFADARAAATGTRWLAELCTDAEQLLAQPGQPTDTPSDALDRLAIAQIAASPLREDTRQFAMLTRTVQDGLAQSEAPAYEQALNALWQLAGATKALKRTSAAAEPDSVWMFDHVMWMGWEAKTGTDPDKEIPAGDVREAASHLTYASHESGQPVPAGSVTLYVTPQQRMHHAAVKVAGAGLYLVTPEQVSQVAERLITAWQTIRTQTRGQDLQQAGATIEATLRMHRVLPSQWLEELLTRRISDG
ncbi:DEAD/DEAH box helicase [Nonomuraea sp. NPDC049421]|uniref:DEAD/DEAH box helicase n=1 Tax=Nonomuraea sp. NPDC049421 TaxID=3155275 RepID=UPI003447AB3A